MAAICPGGDESKLSSQETGKTKMHLEMTHFSGVYTHMGDSSREIGYD